MRPIAARSELGIQGGSHQGTNRAAPERSAGSVAAGTCQSIGPCGKRVEARPWSGWRIAQLPVRGPSPESLAERQRAAFLVSTPPEVGPRRCIGCSRRRRLASASGCRGLPVSPARRNVRSGLPARNSSPSVVPRRLPCRKAPPGGANGVPVAVHDGRGVAHMIEKVESRSIAALLN